jgi:hypothetical protein
VWQGSEIEAWIAAHQPVAEITSDGDYAVKVLTGEEA